MRKKFATALGVLILIVAFVGDAFAQRGFRGVGGFRGGAGFRGAGFVGRGLAGRRFVGRGLAGRGFVGRGVGWRGARVRRGIGLGLVGVGIAGYGYGYGYGYDVYGAGGGCPLQPALIWNGWAYQRVWVEACY